MLEYRNTVRELEGSRNTIVKLERNLEESRTTVGKLEGDVESLVRYGEDLEESFHLLEKAFGE